jgi:hypothetical protein
VDQLADLLGAAGEIADAGWQVIHRRGLAGDLLQPLDVLVGQLQRSRQLLDRRRPRP